MSFNEGASAAANAAEPPPASFETLPLGPLANTVLFLRESDLAELLRANKEISASAPDSSEFWRERCCSTFGGHVKCIQSLDKNAFRTFLEAKRHARDQSLPPRDEWHEYSDQLLRAAVGVSSQDRHEEAASHTLVQSQCALELDKHEVVHPIVGERCQHECGCLWNLKCYWSSEPSPISDKNEWLEYEMVDALAVVSSFVLIPYTSYWQPEQPTYNPVEACVQLTHPEVNQGEPYYESPSFVIQPSMTRQTFDLPEPVLSLGGRAKVLLLGMARRQTLGAHEGETANHYHICISHAALKGTIVCSCRLAIPDGVKPRGRATVSPSGVTAADKSSRERERSSSLEGSSMEGVCRPRGQEMRLQWVVTVSVRKQRSKQAGRRGGGGSASPARGMVLKEFDDTSCLQVLEAYLWKSSQRLEDVRLTLVDDPERVFPADGILGDFAVGGRLDLWDSGR